MKVRILILYETSPVKDDVREEVEAEDEEEVEYRRFLPLFPVLPLPNLLFPFPAFLLYSFLTGDLDLDFRLPVSLIGDGELE